MPEVIHDISDRLKLSIADEREHRYKLIFGGHSTFVYFDETEWDTVKELIEQDQG